MHGSFVAAVSFYFTHKKEKQSLCVTVSQDVAKGTFFWKTEFGKHRPSQCTVVAGSGSCGSCSGGHSLFHGPSSWGGGCFLL